MMAVMVASCLSAALGWCARSWVAHEDAMARHRMQKSIERARMMHPSSGSERGTYEVDDR